MLDIHMLINMLLRGLQNEVVFLLSYSLNLRLRFLIQKQLGESHCLSFKLKDVMRREVCTYELSLQLP